MTTRATAPNPFLEDFAAHAAELPSAGLPWLDARRADAIKLVRAQGIPHRQIEDWKYTDLRAALEGANDLGKGAGVASLRNTDGLEVFEFGSDAPLWVVENFGAAGMDDTMSAASLALSQSTLALRVPANASPAQPVEFEFGGAHARLLIVVESGAAITLLEAPAGGEESFSNAGVEIVLREGTRLNHIRTASNAASAIVIEDLTVRVAAGAQYRAHFMSTGAKLSRTELHVTLEGETAEAHVSGVSVLDDGRHADVTTHIVHAAADTRSTQLFKDIAGGHSRAVYQGKITVAKGADGSDSRQTAKGLLLGLRAEIDLKPELEIFADDVKCAHGAAVGDLDVESLFYLRSRGIPEAEARALLMRAFLGDAVDEIENADIRASVWLKVEAALAKATEASP
ncbi:MAG: Fe-S cluster assembly protein SufD [Rhizomicrobium sp.]